MAILVQNISVILACVIMAVHFSVSKREFMSYRDSFSYSFLQQGLDGLDENEVEHDPLAIASISASVITFFTLSYLASMAAR